jgi:ABC-2 type transport system permease protein
MIRLVRAEARKLRTTRTFYAIVIGALAIIASGTTSLSLAGSFSLGDQPARQVLAVAGIAQTFALILGVLAVTNEFRHGTITSALLVTPKRTPVLVAKLVTLAIGGLVFGLIAFGGAAAITMSILHERHVVTHVTTGNVVAIVIGGTLATGLFAALGVGIGAVIRNQVGSIIAALALLYVIEPILTILPGISNAAQTYGLGGISSAASGTTPLHATAHILSQAPAVLVLAVYAAVLLVAGTGILRVRDVTE